MVDISTEPTQPLSDTAFGELHNVVVKDVLGLAESLLKKVDIETLEYFKTLLESKIDRKELDEKANKTHVHSLMDLPGLRRNETFLETLKGMSTALSSKAPKIHSHSLRDLVSILELESFVKSVMYPSFESKIWLNGKDVIMESKTIVTNGYYMAGVYFEFKMNSPKQPHWTVLKTEDFQYGITSYSAIVSPPEDEENCDFEISVKDNFNPNLIINSKIISINTSSHRDPHPHSR